MKIVFFGTPQFAVPSLQALLSDPDFEVVAVVTQPDKRRGRGSQVLPSPIKTLALSHQLPVWQPARLKQDPETLTQLQLTQADAFVVVAYGQILPPGVLAMPRWGCINVHGSLLPAYRGAAPIQWCLYHGDKETGITTMLMDEGMDTGAMVQKYSMPIPLAMNAQELGAILADRGAELLLETLRLWPAGDLSPVSQDSTLATYAPLITKEMYPLDWKRSALALHNQVRGFYPHSFTHYQGQALKVLATVPLGLGLTLGEPFEFLQSWQPASPDWEALEPGTIVEVLKNQGPIVRTGQGFLLISEGQLAGKRVQRGIDLVNGLRLQPGLSQLG